MVPLSKRAHAVYVVGERYTLAPHQARSMETHNHYFAALQEIWENLPEELALRYPTAEHMRKLALIHKGYHTNQDFVAASKAEAIRLAAFCRQFDEYALVITKEAVVTVYRPKSQSMRAMGKAEFGKSKQDVLDYCEGLIHGAR
jgi:hypothetical protein